MSDTSTSSIADETLLLSVGKAAALCGTSTRTWRRWDSAGLIPSPVRIGRTTRWRREDVLAWIAAKCPRRQEWERRKLGKTS
jgi:excisionase family DNA binding protein